MAIDRLVRDNNKCIWYSNDCISILKGNEIKSMSLVLTALYKHHLKNVDSDKRGLTQEKLAEKTGLADDTVGRTVWKLCPQFINIKTTFRMHQLRKPKYHTINKYGIMLVKKILEKKQNGV